MNLKTILTAALLLFACGSLQAKNNTGKPQIAQQTGGLDVKITFYASSIVRVTKTLPGGPLPGKSYSVIMQPQAANGIRTSREGDRWVAASDRISVTLDTRTGEIVFADSLGHRLLADTKTTLVRRTDKANAGKLRARQCFRLDNDEAVYGLGQLRDTYMSQRGRRVELWNHNTYIAMPYITSEKGYGLYWDNAGKTYFDDTTADTTAFDSEVATAADYYFIYSDGTQDGVVAGIRCLTGQATMLPRWAMGFWQCRERYKTSDELAEVLDRYRELRIPTDAIVQDWQYWGCDSNWNAMRFMNPYYIN